MKPRYSVVWWSCLLASVATSASAVTNVWITAGAGDWFNAGNWSLGRPPTAGDDVVISASGAVVSLTNATAPVASLALSQSLFCSNWFSAINAGTLTIASNGVITLPAAFTNNASSNRVWIVCTNLVVDAGGVINADSKGYIGGLSISTPGHGLGGGAAATNSGGGGHGGGGGLNATSINDVADAPQLPGSGGGSGSYSGGGAGGGVVRIQASGTVTLNGVVSAKGGNGQFNEAGGGAGGSVYISARTIGGSGYVRVNGGNVVDVNAGDGGGGRVAIWRAYDGAGSIFSQVYASGGSNGIIGASGTIVWGALPDLALSPAQVATNAPVGAAATNEIAIWNGGLDRVTNTLAWTAATTNAWIALGLTNGIISGTLTSVVRVTASAGALPPGVHTGSVDFTASDTNYFKYGPLAPSFIVKLPVVLGVNLVAPGGVTATDAAFTDRVRVTWTSVAGVSGYEVLRNTVNTTNGWTPLAFVTTNVYDDLSPALVEGALYYYWVRVTNGNASALGGPDSGYRREYGAFSISLTPATIGGGWVLTAHPSDYTGRTNGSDGYTNAWAPVGTYAVAFTPATDYTTPAALTSAVYASSLTNPVQFVGGYVGIDSDGDGLADVDERARGTDPADTDTDGDWYRDGDEVALGTDPLDAHSYLRGNLTLTEPTGATVARMGGVVDLNWSGPRPLGTADVYLARGDTHWVLETGVLCPQSQMTLTLYLPKGLTPDTNYHVLAIGPGAVPDFGDSDRFALLAPTHGDTDGDGYADFTLYYPPTGLWAGYRTTQGYWYQPFGWSETKPVPADYDGDGRMDLAVYYPTGDAWNSSPWYVLTWQYEFYAVGLGWSTARPVPGDYDGDGRADFGLYDASGYWLLVTWNGAYEEVYAGGAEWGPTVADYDGDGMDDLGLYGATRGEWYLRLSGQNNQWTRIALGGPNQIPVPGDYDGDGAAEPAVYHTTTGLWTFRSSDGVLSYVSLGGSGADPVPSDYDRDGKADIGVFYRPWAYWYLRLTTDGDKSGILGWEGMTPLY